MNKPDPIAEREAKIAALQASIDKAREFLWRVCGQQSFRLKVCIPARPGVDDDCVIADGLEAGKEAVALMRSAPDGNAAAEIDRLRAENERRRKKRLAALPAQQPEPAAEAFRDAVKNCTGEMFGEQAAVKPAAEPQVEPVALEVVAEKAAEWLTLCSHNDDKNSGTHSKVAHALRAAIRPVTGNMHPVLYWLDDGKFARAMLVAQSGLGGHLVVDLTTGDGPSVIGMPDWWDAGYVAAYGGLVPECAFEGKEPGQWSYGVAQLPSYTVAQQPEPEPDAATRDGDEVLRCYVRTHGGLLNLCEFEKTILELCRRELARGGK